MANLGHTPPELIEERNPSLSEVLLKPKEPADLVILEATNKTSASTCLERVLSAERPKILAEDTVRFLELESLIRHLPRPMTQFGRDTLRQSVVEPIKDFEIILDRRDTIKFLSENPKIRATFESAVKALGELFEIYTNNLYDSETLAEGIDNRRDLAEKAFLAINNLPDVNECPLLLGIKEELQAFTESTKFQDLLGPTGYANRKFYSQSEFGSVKKIKILKNKDATSAIFEHGLKTLYLFGATFVTSFSTSVAAIELESSILANTGLVVAFCSLFALMGVAASRAERRNRLSESLRSYVNLQNSFWTHGKGAPKTCSILGLLDELCSQSRAKGNFLELVDEETHSIKLTNAKNPQLAYSGRKPVPIDFEIQGGSPVAFTGPKACGKTGAIKTILQTQLLAQAGYKAPAQSGKVCIADYIVMDAFEVSTLEDGTSSAQKALESHGRIFNSIGPERAIAFFDEIGQGASDLEVAPLIRDDYIPFLRDNDVSAILVLHNNDFVRELAEDKLITPLCVKEVNGIPTYKLYKGVSNQSNYIQLAKRSGVSGEALREITKRNREAKRDNRH